MAGIADHWKAFSGFNNWDGVLIPPINTDFRRYLIHYGEKHLHFLDVIHQKNSSPMWVCKMVIHSNIYQVTKYFYLKLDDFADFMEFDIKESAWIGYVAVTTDEGNTVLGRRDVLVCWRGTILVPTIPRCTMVFTASTWPKAQAPSTIRTVLENRVEELEIDSSKSPYSKDPNAESHNLDIYLHAIAGYQGELGEFRLVIDRDSALVNKSADVLPEKYKVPPNWRTVMNKCMIQMDNGFWKLNDCVPDPPSEDDIEGNITAIFLKDNTPLAL
ncbi:phospholipase A1-IIalpha [Populus alba]|uniref:phospholipase A1-IIalpha n=1 Tax=Populus alba TaxID=43335 RepID=UPI003CC7306C